MTDEEYNQLSPEEWRRHEFEDRGLRFSSVVPGRFALWQDSGYTRIDRTLALAALALDASDYRFTPEELLRVRELSGVYPELASIAYKMALLVPPPPPTGQLLVFSPGSVSPE